MSYITGVQTLAKGDREEIFFDKGIFIFATSFADPYFSNDLVWKRIALHYKDASSGQRQIVILKDDNGRGWFAPSDTSRSGVWAIEKIQVFDKDGDFFTVMRSSMPTPSSFDITVNKRVAPSSAVVSFELAPELNADGDFSLVSTVEDAGWVKFTSNGSDAVIEGGELKLQTDPNSLNTIAVEKTLSLLNDERYLLKYTLNERNAGGGSVPEVLEHQEVMISKPFFESYETEYDPNEDQVSLSANGMTIQGNGSGDAAGLFFDPAGVTSMVVGESYRLEVDVQKISTQSSTGTFTLQHFDGSSMSNTSTSVSVISTSGQTLSKTFVATATNSLRMFVANALLGHGVHVIAYRLIKEEVNSPGIINDMSVTITDNLENVIAQETVSEATAMERVVSFKAKGVTKFRFATSGQDGFWKMDDISIKKNPDACTIAPEEVQYYQVGFKIKLMDVSTGTFLTPDIYTIEKIEGDKITFDQPISGSYEGKNLILKFPTFSECSAAQKGLFQFVGAGY